MSPAQRCRSSTEPLEEQILRAAGNLREQPLLPPTALRNPSAPRTPGISSACAICSLGSHPRHSQALSQEPRSCAAVLGPGPCLPPSPGGSGSAWREGGWLADLLFVVLVLKCRIITKATGSHPPSLQHKTATTRVLKILGISPVAQQALPGCPVISSILALQLPHLNTPNNLEFVTNPNLQTVLDRSCTAWSCCRAAPCPELWGSPGSLVQVGPVIRALDVDPPHALDALPLLVLLQVVGAPCSPSCGFQEGIVRPPPILGFVQKNVQGLLVNSGFWELHLAGREEKVTQCRQ